MARPKQFEAQAVLERLAEVFTAHGYNGTSLSMLTAASGLGKQSLYNSFGDKRSMYLKSMGCYARRVSAARFQQSSTTTGLAAVKLLMDGLLTACASPEPAVHTCMMSAGLLEGVEESEVRAGLQELWRTSDRMLLEAVNRGQKDGSIRTDLPNVDLSRYLMTLMSGLRVASRAIDSESQLRKVSKLAVRFLEPVARHELS